MKSGCQDTKTKGTYTCQSLPPAAGSGFKDSEERAKGLGSGNVNKMIQGPSLRVAWGLDLCWHEIQSPLKVNTGKQQPFPGGSGASQRKSSGLEERHGVLVVWCLQSWDTQRPRRSLGHSLPWFRTVRRALLYEGMAAV